MDSNGGEPATRQRGEKHVERAAQPRIGLKWHLSEAEERRHESLRFMTMNEQRPVKTRAARSILVPLLAFFLFGFVAWQPAHAQSAEDLEALKLEIEALRQGQAAIQKDVEAIRKILEGAVRPAQARAFEPGDITVADSPFLGKASAPVVIVEFSDFQCPFCSRHFKIVMPQLKKNYVETGKLKYVMREFPIESIHSKAFKASEAALCAGDQDQYWAMHDRIFEDQRRVAPEDLMAHAEALDLDMSTFRDCFDSNKYAQKVRDDIQEGTRAGVTGTPSFFVGLADPNDPTKIRATEFIRGAQPYAVFKRAIDELLKQSS
jgi:protein-disulfide isomerase